MSNKASIRPSDSDTILVPVDFTETTENGLRHAITLARIFSKRLVLLHVVGTGKNSNAVQEKALARLNELISKYSDSGISMKAHAEKGNIFDTIGEVADQENAVLVVMGTHGVLGMQKVLGSKALKVILNATKPFVVVQKKPIKSEGYKNIVLPIDFSKETKQKLMWAVELGKKFEAEFKILVAFENDEFIARGVKNNLAYAENFLKSHNCKFTVHQASKGDFAKETISFAAQSQADLIIIMTNQEKDLAHYIVGPYEQNVIANDAQIPVMTLHPVITHNAVNGHLFNFGNF
jgi:nucleotide-binding universal stress UspA family protein